MSGWQHMWPHSWAWPPPFVSGVPTLIGFCWALNYFMWNAQKSAWCWDAAGVRSCHHHQGQHHLLLQAGIGTVGAARSINPDLLQFYPRNIYQGPPMGRAVPGSVPGNWADTTKSDWVAAISHHFLSDLLTLLCSPVDSGASLALPGAPWEERTRSGDWIPVLALLWPTRWPQSNPSLL